MVTLKMADDKMAAKLVLEDGTIFSGKSFGSKQCRSGEVGKKTLDKAF